MDLKYDILYRLYKLISNDSDQQINGTLDFFLNNLEDLEQFEEWFKSQKIIPTETFDELFNRWFREREERLKEEAFKDASYLEQLD
jgi:hypothetical protein